MWRMDKYLRKLDVSRRWRRRWRAPCCSPLHAGAPRPCCCPLPTDGSRHAHVPCKHSFRPLLAPFSALAKVVRPIVGCGPGADLTAQAPHPTTTTAPLQAALVVADRHQSLQITGNGDVLEPHDGVIAIGSGSPYALAAARALIDLPDMDALSVGEAGRTGAVLLVIEAQRDGGGAGVEREVGGAGGALGWGKGAVGTEPMSWEGALALLAGQPASGVTLT